MTRPNRPSLETFIPVPPTGATVQHVTEPAESRATDTRRSQYPSISVYLTPDEIRTLKLIALDQGVRPSSLAATAIREWFERNGHSRPPRNRA